MLLQLGFLHLNISQIKKGQKYVKKHIEKREITFICSSQGSITPHL